MADGRRGLDEPARGCAVLRWSAAARCCGGLPVPERCPGGVGRRWCRVLGAVAHGGVSIEDPPGLREGKAGALHLAYVRDPDGNKLCAVYRGA